MRECYNAGRDGAGDERGVSIVASSVVGLDPCGQLKNVVKSVQVLGEVRLIPFVAAEL